MQQVNVFIETSSRFRGNVERKCGYVLSTQLRTGKETREHFGRVTGTYVDKIEEKLNAISESGSVRCYACRYCKKVDTENGSSLYCAKDSGRLSKTTYDSTCLNGKK